MIVPGRRPHSYQFDSGWEEVAVAGESQHRDRRRIVRSRRRDEAEHFLAALEAAEVAAVAPDERGAGDGLERVARADHERRGEGSLDREVDERRAQPHARPDATADEEHGRERDSRRRPDGSRVAGRYGDQQRELRSGKVRGSEQVENYGVR